MMNIRLKIVLTSLLTALSCQTYAVDFNLNSIFSGVFAISDNEAEYVGGIKNKPNLDGDTSAGIQLTLRGDEPGWQLTTLLLAKGEESFNLETDTAYLTYYASERTTVRAGRIKFPPMLAAEYIEIGFAYPWIRPPAEVYGPATLGFDTMTGIDLVYEIPFDAFTIRLQPFFGRSEFTQGVGLFPFDPTNPDAIDAIPLTDLLAVYSSAEQAELLALDAAAASNPGALAAAIGSGSSLAVFTALSELLGHDFDYVTAVADNMSGLNIIWSNEFSTFRLAYGRMTVPNIPDAKLTESIDGLVEYFSFAGELDWNNLISYLEIIRRNVAGDVPDLRAGYLTLGYRFGATMPHITFAAHEPIQRGLPYVEQESIIFGVRHDLNSSVALKIETQHIRPKGGFSGSQGIFIDGTPGTDVNIFSLAVDMFF